ncbi:MAG: nicotinate-nucleotide diphosphorylase (carboxylating), partial [Thermoleophilia bacterium]|nr:nicotinate-nucleotide diphosphorylase (carboxylating) [Thermoleophilia bacterium]
MIDQASLSLVRAALAEDLAGYGDITSTWTVPADLQGRAEITAREDMVVCGLPLAAAVLQEVEP